MKDLLIGVIEIIGGYFEVLSTGKNLKRTLLITFGLLFIVFVIVYYLTKDFETVNVISR